MITFKQFLFEGGKATEKFGTVRANQADMKSAIKFVAKHTGIDEQTLAGRLLGSARLTFKGSQKDSGDIDLAISTEEVDKESIVAKMKKATGMTPHVTGGSTYSFAVPTTEGRKVQVDLMFVPDVEWAKFSYHAAEDSKHKSGVRNELLHSALKWSMEPGKDLRLKDASGNDVVRASRAYKLDVGVERIFKMAPKRKDGKGRVKGVAKADPSEIQTALDELGHSGKFSHEPELIRNPDEFAKLLFGPSVKGKDMMSTEQLIALIKKYKAKFADEIFKDAVKGMKRLKFAVPAELKKYE